MQPAPKMQQIIEAIAAKHGLDLAADHAHLRLTMPHYDRLVIEKIAAKQISVAHGVLFDLIKMGGSSTITLVVYQVTPTHVL